MVRRSKSLPIRRRPAIDMTSRLLTLAAVVILILMGCGRQSVDVVETDPFESERARQRDRIRLQISRNQRLYGPAPHQAKDQYSTHNAHMTFPHATLRTEEQGGKRPIFARPVKAAHVTSHFGLRPDPFGSNRLLFHNGIDFGATTGTLVRAGAPGRVIAVTHRPDGCGLSVSVLHDDDYVSEFCHLDRARVTLHQIVQLGSIIGDVGTTGHTAGPHLHWTLWRQGIALNPELFLVKTEQ
ncbi:MAG: M23 family metallopeptidase [Bradymonadia bacterium]